MQLQWSNKIDTIFGFMSVVCSFISLVRSFDGINRQFQNVCMTLTQVPVVR